MIAISSGQTVIQGPNDARVYDLNWTDTLADAVELVDAGTVTITTEDEVSPSLSDDELELLAGNRGARVRLSGGVLGAKYRVHHRIETNESPAQTIEKSFFVLIQHR